MAKTAQGSISNGFELQENVEFIFNTLIGFKNTMFAVLNILGISTFN